jgi:hypothetical protein
VLPLRGTHGVAGRTVSAVKLTLRDVAEDSITTLVFSAESSDRAHGGGLRGGRYRIGTDNTLELDGVSYLPRVTVSGRVERFLERRQSGRLRVGGRAAPHGVLEIHGFEVSGRLGGRRVHGNLSSPVVVAASARALGEPPLSRLRERARTRLLF